MYIYIYFTVYIHLKQPTVGVHLLFEKAICLCASGVRALKRSITEREYRIEMSWA